MSHPSDRNERLHTALRRGDPAAGEPDLAPEEVRAMRRAVLSAVPEPRRSIRLVPAFAFASVLAVAFVVGLAIYRSLGPGPVPPEPRIADRPAAPPPVSAPKPPETSAPPEASVRIATATPPALEPVRPRRLHRAVRRFDPAPLIPSAPDRPVEESHTEEPLTRQVQFDTPGGTRIIWMLTEDTHSR